MPFLDANRERPAARPHDVTLIGAGAAGILLAVELTRRGRSVLLIESGHFGLDDSRQELNRVENTGKPLYSAEWGRKRAIGGSTLAWGGQSLPFAAHDFTRKPWIPLGGWPICAEELAADYALANRFMGVDELDYEAPMLGRLGIDVPAFDPEHFHFHVSKWAPQPDFRIRHGRHLRRHVDVLYNASVLDIALDAGGAPAAVEMTSFNGERFRLPARTVVVAAGGIESNRLLLGSVSGRPGGAGNESGWLGRCFMEHPSLEIGELHPADADRTQAILGPHRWRGRKYSLRVSAAEADLARRRLLNWSATFLFGAAPGRPDAVADLRALLRRPAWAPARRLARSWPDLARSAARLAFRGYAYKANAVATVGLMVEQEPTPSSRIELGDSRDRFGQRRARVHWEISPLTWTTVAAAAPRLAAELARVGLGRLDLRPGLTPDNPGWSDLLGNANHHMGGTRMSAAAEGGVVDRDLQVWRCRDLFVCSASVFPTSSHSNPTLTLLALAQRLVRHLTRDRH